MKALQFCIYYVDSGESAIIDFQQENDKVKAIPQQIRGRRVWCCKSLDLVFRPPVSPSPGPFAIGGREVDSETGDTV